MKVLLAYNSWYSTFLHNVLNELDIHNHIILWNPDEIENFGDYDIGISFMYTHKIPSKEVNTHTWFNFHPAPLPEYKGRNLCYHAIMNGEKEFGATLHYMDEDFDTGEIIKVRRFDIEDWMTAEDVSQLALTTSEELFVEYFPRILAREEFERHPNVGGAYYHKEEISDDVWVNPRTQRLIRAIYYPPHYPKIEIGGVTYKIVRDE